MHLINKIKRSILQKKEMLSVARLENFAFANKHAKHPLFKELEKEYKKYVNEISVAEMAVSYQLSVFILAYCLEYHPKTLLDLGSGFSSFVLRLYQAKIEPSAIVHSIDDDRQWLERTKNYLKQHQLNTENVDHVDDLSASALHDFFDLVLLDLNFIEKRRDYIGYAIQKLKPPGILLIDDVHKVEFLREVKSSAKKGGHTLYNIKKETFDQFGRFAIALKK